MITCGALFHDLMTQLETHPLMGPDTMPLKHLAHDGDVIAYVRELCFAHRAIGFFIGQAEKVHLGAARMFLVRPAPEWFDWTCAAMQLVCEHYGLTVLMNQEPLEIWGIRPEWVELARQVQALPYPSAEVHWRRGRLCGIPAEEIDTAYEQREGHGVRCEVEVTTQQEA